MLRVNINVLLASIKRGLEDKGNVPSVIWLDSSGFQNDPFVFDLVRNSVVVIINNQTHTLTLIYTITCVSSEKKIKNSKVLATVTVASGRNVPACRVASALSPQL